MPLTNKPQREVGGTKVCLPSLSWQIWSPSDRIPGGMQEEGGGGMQSQKLLLYGFIRFPLYYHVKFAFLVWLQLPSVNAKFVSAHQTEIQFARTLFMKIFGAVNQVVGDFFHPGKKQANRAIEGPTTNVQTQPDSVIESLTTQEQNSESESDE
ncbi:hypothetical protein TEA_012076 [Camellia sinensis var. sinensis]|uniref:HVA22-like protein n=1 Tax=Camellia sinensis var. sinensis TaxID=542762 RepID=A0A4S4DIM0_CAMSN|nr:hypothetical protein TEA_012076 [Camellia sinensis var. sinensis]